MEPLTSSVLLLGRVSQTTRYRRGRYTSEKTIFSPSEIKTMTFLLRRSLRGRFTVCKYLRTLADSRCQIIAQGPELTATRKTHTRNRYRTRPSIHARPVANRRECRLGMQCSRGRGLRTGLVMQWWRRCLETRVAILVQDSVGRIRSLY